MPQHHSAPEISANDRIRQMLLFSGYLDESGDEYAAMVAMLTDLYSFADSNDITLANPLATARLIHNAGMA